MPENGTPHRSGPTLVDRGFQVAYRCAYQLMRGYWGVRHPKTHGALVVIRNGGEVLLVRNSYVPYYSLPGGYVRRHETALQAALRELAEEVGVSAASDALQLVHDETHDWEGKRDHVEIFALDIATRPRVAVDHREVIEASWWPPERALTLDLFPPLRHVLEKDVPSGRAPPSQTPA
jgi:ADP-ribose pyrophosphatase YjhB (NUDIX family)